MPCTTRKPMMLNRALGVLTTIALAQSKRVFILNKRSVELGPSPSGASSHGQSVSHCPHSEFTIKKNSQNLPGWRARPLRSTAAVSWQRGQCRPPRRRPTRRCHAIEFDTMDAAKTFYESDEYTAAKAIREMAAKTDLLLIEGI